jgi:hypothetical protein
VKVRTLLLKGTEQNGARTHRNCLSGERSCSFCYATLGFKTVLPEPYSLIVRMLASADESTLIRLVIGGFLM